LRAAHAHSSKVAAHSKSTNAQAEPTPLARERGGKAAVRSFKSFTLTGRDDLLHPFVYQRDDESQSCLQEFRIKALEDFMRGVETSSPNPESEQTPSVWVHDRSWTPSSKPNGEINHDISSPEGFLETLESEVGFFLTPEQSHMQR
jgi:hypothetical protein